MKKILKNLAKLFAKENELRFVWMNLIFQALFAYLAVQYGGLKINTVFVIILFLPITCGLCWTLGRILGEYY